MKINDSSTVLSNNIANSKPTSRSASPNVKDAEVVVQQSDEVSASKPVEKAKEIEANKAERVAKELQQEQLSANSDKEVQEKVESAVETIRGFIQENQRDLDFDVAKESNRVIITVRDKQTDEVIRQIPPEDAIELAERIESGDDITTSGVLLEGNA